MIRGRGEGARMQGVDIGTEGARRLARAVKAERERRRWTQRQVAERSAGAFAPSTLQTVERGKNPRVAPRTLHGLRVAFHWTDDSIDLILKGDTPVAQKTDDGDEIARAVELIRSGVDRLERAVASRQA